MKEINDAVCRQGQVGRGRLPPSPPPCSGVVWVTDFKAQLTMRSAVQDKIFATQNRPKMVPSPEEGVRNQPHPTGEGG